MTRLSISQQKHKELKRRMRRLRIFEKDMKETFVRSSGPGGQNVNKVSSCVVLHHLPTGIQVKYHKERTQGLNRYQARCLMADKVEKSKRDAQRKMVQEIQKVKRQTRKRPEVLKEKILQKKHQHAQKKKMREKIKTHKLDKYL